MKRFFKRNRSLIVGLAAIAVLALTGTALANRSIRDGTINTRDIKDNQVNSRDIRDGSITTRDIRDNQVNTKDVRDGSIRGVDINDGSIGLSDLDAQVKALTGSATLVDPRAQKQDDHASWAKGPIALAAGSGAPADPLPDSSSGSPWRAITLEPGTYLVVGSATAAKESGEAEGVATRLFLGGKPLPDGTGYGMVPVSATALPAPTSSSTVLEVASGDPATRQLTERVAAVGGPAKYADDLAIVSVAPR